MRPTNLTERTQLGGRRGGVPGMGAKQSQFAADLVGQNWRDLSGWRRTVLVDH